MSPSVLFRQPRFPPNIPPLGCRWDVGICTSSCRDGGPNRHCKFPLCHLLQVHIGLLQMGRSAPWREDTRPRGVLNTYSAARGEQTPKNDAKTRRRPPKFASSAGWSSAASLGVVCRRRRDVTLHPTHGEGRDQHPESVYSSDSLAALYSSKSQREVEDPVFGAWRATAGKPVQCSIIIAGGLVPRARRHDPAISGFCGVA
ncbi:hypothetical protein QBC47DRAFT_182037 [Echria macrotheca]|uniref:Uncharacterized protein n=1 Tax=Echria macrotheca TaxID=438768 RepID=A0AAJ0BFJ5_9PEZI|nr:hypothetical protein QBC47DRAFT_182037 [Echria macrotheca]